MKQTIEQTVLLDLLKGRPICLPEEFGPRDFFLLLLRHKLLPVSKELLHLIPEKNSSNWQVQLMKWKQRSSLLCRELLRVNSLLNEAGVSVLNLKGPSLAIQLFGSEDLRYYNDLDVVVHPESILQAIDLLSEYGYEPEDRHELQDLEEHFIYNNDIVLYNKAKGVQLELHIGIYVKHLFKKKYQAEFLKHQEMVVVDGMSLNVLSSEYYFLYLCLHGAKHMYFRLSWLKDIESFLRNIHMDHQKVMSLAKEYELEKMLSLSLLLVNEFFYCKIPVEYDALMKRKKYSGLLRMNRKIILGPGELIYENYLDLKRKTDQKTGINEVSISLMLAQLRYLVALRKGLFRKIAFLFYQIKKRCSFCSTTSLL